ncbi:MAG: type II secretion system protein [Oscillospiraceae bacterium]|nr:type II secretion system protein [Oscillospiraceae bacterium]
MKKMNKKGFTLAELLIVVAIIAVLVAIAIPVFAAQLEKSREATDVANVRSAYASLVSEYLLEPGSNTFSVSAKQETAGWATSPDPVLKAMQSGKETDVPIPAKTDTYTVKIDKNGKVTVS